MKHLQTALIIVDGTEGVQKAASRIASCLKDMHVVIMDGADFAATDLLPAAVCFFGCEKPHPTSYVELERVLKGINLASRPCGLFTLASKDAIEYLRGIVRDTDLRLNPNPFMAEKSTAEREWTAVTLQRS